MKKYYLCLQNGRFQTSIYPLAGSATLGRSSESDITFVDPKVSRSHARIIFQKGRWVIEDLGSANGVIFAGERMVKKALQSGDAFQIGEATLRLMEEDTLDDIEQLAKTIQVFAALINYQSPLALINYPSHLKDPAGSHRTFMRVQGALLSTPIFRSLGKKELRGLEDVTNLHLFSADQRILNEGDPGRSIYIILAGKVKVFSKDNEGNEFQLATLVPNQFFGEMAFLNGKPRSGSVATVEESLLGEISYNHMRRLMLRYPQVKGVLLDYFRTRVEDSEKKRTEASIKERRSEPRLNERLIVRFTVWPEESLPEAMIKHTYKATSSDISSSGMLLVVLGPAMEAFRPGGELQLEIELPVPWKKLSTMATIRHVDCGEHAAQLGIEFSNPSPENKQKLQDFLYGQTHTIE